VTPLLVSLLRGLLLVVAAAAPAYWRGRHDGRLMGQRAAARVAFAVSTTAARGDEPTVEALSALRGRIVRRIDELEAMDRSGSS